MGRRSCLLMSFSVITQRLPMDVLQGHMKWPLFDNSGSMPEMGAPRLRKRCCPAPPKPGLRSPARPGHGPISGPVSGPVTGHWPGRVMIRSLVRSAANHRSLARSPARSPPATSQQLFFIHATFFSKFYPCIAHKRVSEVGMTNPFSKFYPCIAHTKG